VTVEEAIAGAVARFERALAHLAPDAPTFFNPPASRDNLAHLEATIGRPIPEQLQAWLAQHDGTARIKIARWRLVSAQTIASDWTFECEAQAGYDFDADTRPDPGVHARWWDPAWIPLAEDGFGNHLCIDLDPTPGGTTGQVIEFVHDHGVRPREAASLVEWFDIQARGLEDGTLVIVEGVDGAFQGVMVRAHLTGATLALCRIRGESVQARRTRIEREILGNSWALTSIVIALLRREGRVRMAPGTDKSPQLLLLVHEILAGEGTLPTRLDRVVAALPACPGVEHVAVRADAVLADLEALLT
jgi:cell wall assembly regulator SMI1